jgi:predicted metal-binding protein
MNSPDTYAFIHKACELGAAEAKIINTDSIVTGAWVRMKCQFGCPGYNQSRCCPPNTPTPEQTRMVIDGYTHALLIHFHGKMSKTNIVSELEREIFLNGFYKALGFGAGPCRLCEKCSPKGCIHPEKARPSMEACGIDVYATVRANGYPINVLTDRSAERNYYGLILIE